MDFLETPEQRFEGLKDYPFEPRFQRVDAAGLRMHYVDEGPRGAAPVLMLHGEPSWSYLYRFMIPPCAAAGHRVVAPDLIGFGRSSKPRRIADYSYQHHCNWLQALIEALDLQEITLFCQDWGSLLGLRLAAELEDRFARVVVGNGFLPDGARPGFSLESVGTAAAFLTWRTFARFAPQLPVARILQFGSARRLDADELRAYDTPFPDERYKAGARAFPRLVPISPRDPAVPANRRAWEVLEKWEKPFLTTFSDGDPVTRGYDRRLRDRIPGAKGMPHRTFPGGHFLQEDSGPELAAHMLDWIAKFPAARAAESS
ncbi:MAG: haloalkane dehalogenase [Proteobacteria bacterium]|nr:haloalkane dehalogenase [Pseudomonadota bacterium]